MISGRGIRYTIGAFVFLIGLLLCATGHTGIGVWPCVIVSGFTVGAASGYGDLTPRSIEADEEPTSESRDTF